MTRVNIIRESTIFFLYNQRVNYFFYNQRINYLCIVACLFPISLLGKVL